ncbi:MAG TPA: elongation factor P-like protein YeiP [Gammaproteobacteria bacterium]|nr:elongation factor P-like protein YeiP [Gammaproteobacteria bacterium]
MIKANELKKAMVVGIDGHRFIVKDIQVKSPSSRGSNTLYKVRFNNIVSKQKMENTYKGEDVFEEVDFFRRAVQLIYKESDSSTFMDNEDFAQYTIDNAMIEEELLYLTDGLEGLLALIADGELLGIELPPSVDLEIIECAPSIKGASASARTKPATLSTGLIVQVPEYLAAGEVIKVNTSNAKFMSRAS